MSELSEIHGESPGQYVVLGKATNSVQFNLQEGPIGEVGENGCQIDELICFARKTIASFQERFPCRENALALTKLDEALHWLEARTRDRTQRAVEGKNEA